MENNVVKIHPKDNVAVALREIKAGEAIVGIDGKDLKATGDIPPSHKVAITKIPAGEAAIKYGEPIGDMKKTAKPGEWVHSHNINTEEG